MPFEIAKQWKDLPFGHRQPAHEGHCHDLHGHNWDFTFVFTCDERDDKGFVVDFGGLKQFKAELDRDFDHKMVFNHSDTEMRELAKHTEFMPITWVEDCSAEGLAKLMYERMTEYLQRDYFRDVETRGLRVARVIVHEDSKNTATYFE